MYLKNPHYSNVDLYIKELDDYLNQGYELKTTFKQYDKRNDNYTFFNLFDFETVLKKDLFIFKKIKYKGFLRFKFDELTGMVTIDEVPYVVLGNEKIYVFTSDLAESMLEILKRQGIQMKGIKFNNFSSLYAINAHALSLIPQIKNTQNYMYLEKVQAMISKEEDTIKAEITSCQKHHERLEKAKGRVLARRRKILGLDPKDYVTDATFNEQLVIEVRNRIEKKIECAERHIRALKDAYKKLVIKSNSGQKIANILWYYLLKQLPEDAIKSITGRWDQVGSFEKLLFEWNWSDQCDPEWLKKIKELKDLYDYFHDRYTLNEIDENKLNTATEIMLEYDLHYENGIFDLFECVRQSVLQKEVDIHYQDAGMLTPYKALPHMLHKIIGCEYFSRRYKDGGWGWEKNYERLNGVIDDHPAFFNNYKSIAGIKVYPVIDIIVQINRLEEKLKCYQYDYEHPEKIIPHIESHGTLMRLPFWEKVYIVKHQYYDESYKLVMITPGTKNLSLNSDANYFDKNHRLMVMIPNSLDENEIPKIVDYAHNTGKMINFVCQSQELALHLKKILYKKALDSFCRGEEYFNGWCFINVDPIYYESFLADTPNNKNLWHRYDFSSTYKFHRKDLLSVDKQFEIALKHARNESTMDYRVLDELLFGNYLGYPSEQAFSYYDELRSLTAEIIADRPVLVKKR